MRIAQFAPPFESVPPVQYGGMDQVVALLADESVRRGYQVALFADGNSVTAAQQITTVEPTFWQQEVVLPSRAGTA